MWKCNQSRPGFELVSPCSFPTMITITPWEPPRLLHYSRTLWVLLPRLENQANLNLLNSAIKMTLCRMMPVRRGWINSWTDWVLLPWLNNQSNLNLLNSAIKMTLCRMVPVRRGWINSSTDWVLLPWLDNQSNLNLLNFAIKIT